MRFAPLLSGAASLVLYLALAPPVPGAGDSSELTLVLALDGVAHPTGYPLWTFFGHLFVRAFHALGATWAFAANAWSALGAAAAVGLLHAAARRLLPPLRADRAWAWETLALAPPALLLLQPAWTGVATVAEVYSWHQAWAHGTVLAFLALLGVGATDRSDAERAPRSAWSITAWGLLVGAGLAHHATSLIVSGPLTLVLAAILGPALARGGGARAASRGVGEFALGAVLPLLAYLPLLAKAGREGPGIWPALAPGWDGFVRHVTGAQYFGAARGFALPEADRALLEGSVYPVLVPAIVLLAVATLLARRPRERAALASILAAAALQIVFCLSYRVSDPASYFLPAMGLALLSVPSLIAALAARVRRPAAVVDPAAWLSVALAAWLAVSGTRAALEERRALVGLDQLVRRMWSVIPYREGIVLWRNDMAPRLTTYQIFEGAGRGLEVWNPWQFTDAAVRARFARRHGFDPVGDLALSREALLATDPDAPGTRAFFNAVARRINQGAAFPVILFEPERPDVRVLEKSD
jgi:hypothetical protein